jgi:hypothetical protein
MTELTIDRTFEDAFDLMCGDLIGEGTFRKVYTCRLRPDLVVKVEKHTERDRRFHNMLEYYCWTQHAHCKPIHQWLAPCEDMSPDGRILLQKRARPLHDTDKLPEQLPTFLTDLKRENFGMLDKRIVCIDYAYYVTTTSTRLRKANWR